MQFTLAVYATVEASISAEDLLKKTELLRARHIVDGWESKRGETAVTMAL